MQNLKVLQKAVYRYTPAEECKGSSILVTEAGDAFVE